jgi:hypothetical protein
MPEESGEELVDEEGKNPTQRRIDEEGAEEAPVDANWREEKWGETQDAPHEGEEGQQPA